MPDHPIYELLYHPTIPGRGEFIRLAFEAAGVPYIDVANSPPNGGGYSSSVQKTLGMDDERRASDGGDDFHAPIFAPPALRVRGGGGRTLVISQTANVLLYLGGRLGLGGPAAAAAGDGDEDEGGRWWVNQLTLTALDLGDEVHDTHHPVGVSLYYEEQKAEALRKAKDVRENRLPKFFGHFERALKWNAERGGGGGRYLVGDKLTYADTTVWQVLDGVSFAFPREVEARKKEFPLLFGTFYESVKQEKGLREYLKSERRLPYSQGIFRYYPELDRA